MKSVYQYKSITLGVKDVDTRQGIVTGYFSAFDVEDSGGDVVVKGAFAKTIKEQGPDSARPRAKHLLDHDSTKSISKLLELKEDSYGLYYAGKIGSHSTGRDFIEMVDSGLITEHSFGYQVVKSEPNNKGRILKELKFFEGSSLQGWGVNEFTPLLGIKGGVADDIRIKRLAELERACKGEEVTPELIDTLLLEVRQLTQLTIDLKNNPVIEPTIEVIQPAQSRRNWEWVAKQIIK